MGKRIGLFLLTNLVFVATIGAITAALGFNPLDQSSQRAFTGLAAFCLVWGFGGAFFSLAISRWMAKKAHRIVLIDERTTDPRLRRVRERTLELAARAGLPAPEVGVYDSPELNAFATGPTRRRSLVAVSLGLLNAMSPDEVDGVLAHEVTHIANGDMVTMTLLQGVVNVFVLFFSRLIAFLARMAVDERIAGIVGLLVTIVLDIALGILGMIVVAWFSRRREYRADAGGAALAGKERMVAGLQRLQLAVVDTRAPTMAPYKIAGKRRKGLGLFATHPPLEDRIKRLQESYGA